MASGRLRAGGRVAAPPPEPGDRGEGGCPRGTELCGGRDRRDARERAALRPEPRGGLLGVGGGGTPRKGSVPGTGGKLGRRPSGASSGAPGVSLGAPGVSPGGA